MKRHNQTGEALGKFETRELLEKKRAAYRSVLKTIDHIHIDATQSIEQIHTQIVRHLL